MSYWAKCNICGTVFHAPCLRFCDWTGGHGRYLRCHPALWGVCFTCVENDNGEIWRQVPDSKNEFFFQIPPCMAVPIWSCSDACR